MKQQKVLQYCAIIAALMVLFPPIQLSNGAGVGYGFLFGLEVAEKVNIVSLAVQILLVGFVGAAFYFSARSAKIVTVEAVRSQNPIIKFIADVWCGKKPLEVAFAAWGIAAVAAKYFFSHLDDAGDFIGSRTAQVYIGGAFFVAYFLWATMGIWRSNKKPDGSLYHRGIGAFAVFFTLIAVIMGLSSSLQYLDGVDGNQDSIRNLIKKYPPQSALKPDNKAQAQNTASNDLYGKYPELDTPENRVIVKAVVPLIIKNGDTWTPALRDRIAEQAKAIISASEKISKNGMSKGIAELYGTGFIVSGDGYILTNSHVVAGCKKPYATLGTDKQRVTPIAADRVADLALVKLPEGKYRPAIFRASKVRVGEDVVVAGFPLAGLLSPELNISKGNVSALAGVHGNNKEMQISAPIQAGNSGSPVFDASGHVVGVALANLDVKETYKEYGSIPQNVNFAVSQEPIVALLSKHGVKTQTAESSAALPTASIADAAVGFTVAMECERGA